MKVTFCGHRNCYNDTEYLNARLDEVIEKLISIGANEFMLGNNGQFDHLSARAVKRAKGKHPYIRSILVKAYIDENYDRELYDETEYPPIEKTPLRFAISARNEYLVNICDVLVSGVKVTFGGAATTREKAIKKKKVIIELYSEN